VSKARNIDVALLRTFIAVVDHGSITRASVHIHRTQSAISMQIQRLEGQIGQQIFDRSGRQLMLTYRGKALVAYSRRLLNLHDEAVNQMAIDIETQHLTIGCPDDYSQILLPKLLNILHRKQPNLHITIVTANSGDLRRKMDEGIIDIALLTRLPLSNEGLVVYQSLGVWLAKDNESFSQRPLPLVLVEPSCQFHSSVIDGLEKHNIDYQLLCDASQIQLLISLVRQNNMISVVPDLSVPADLLGKRVVKGLPELPMAEVIICLRGGEQSIIGLSLNEIVQLMK